MFFLAHWIATKLTHQMPALLWITEWGIWPSSENWHLYYTLRQAGHDKRLLHEAPGHLFSNDEMDNLASFLQVSMLNGWGGYLLTEVHHVDVFFSHDEFLKFFAKQAQDLQSIEELPTS